MELQTHGVRKYPPTSALLASSAGLGWSTISVELRAHGVCEALAIVPHHVEICLVVAGNKDGLVRRAGAGFCQEAMPNTGAIWLSPAGVGKEIVITAPIPQTMHLYLPTALFDRLKDDFNLPVAPAHSIRHAVGIVDDVIDQIGRSILSELTVETAAGRMYVETASLTLAARLIYKYCDCGSSALTALDAHPLDQVRLRRVLDYISTNFDDDITLADLARIQAPPALARAFHARPQAGKSGQNNRKPGTDGKRVACSDSAHSPATSFARNDTVATAESSYSGLDALLTPEESVLLLVDHQGFQFANLHSHEPQLVVNNVVALAKTAKLFGVPTILTTVLEERGGYIIKGIQDVFPQQKPINRTFINAWQDKRLVEAVKKTGRKKLIIAALWTEVCLAMPALQAQGEGYDVFAVTDASGGVSAEAHAMGVERMIQAGIKPITWLAVLCEWQRDWARQEKFSELGARLGERLAARRPIP